jgi:hypothetical protein
MRTFYRLRDELQSNHVITLVLNYSNFNAMRCLELSRNAIWEQRLKEAARLHGDECVGLAIGIRAVDIVERELRITTDRSALQVRVGTKECLADAFKALLGLDKGQVECVKPRDGVIRVKNGIEGIELHLTPNKLRQVSDAFERSEEELFPIIRRL